MRQRFRGLTLYLSRIDRRRLYSRLEALDTLSRPMSSIVSCLPRTADAAMRGEESDISSSEALALRVRYRTFFGAFCSEYFGTQGS